MNSLAYKFKGSGHEVPEEKRKYEEPDSRLADAFKKWHMKPLKYRHTYEDVSSLLKKIKPRIDEAHALVVANYDDSDPMSSGLFLSAVYNASTEKDIIFDLCVPVSKLGTHLAKDKRLVAYTPVHNLGSGTLHGKIVNFADTKKVDGIKFTTSFEVLAGSILVNYGTAIYLPGAGVIINTSPNWSLDYSRISPSWRVLPGFYFDVRCELGDTLVTLEVPKEKRDEEQSRKQNPRLHAHCKKLREIVEAGRQKPFEMLDKLDATKIKKDLEKILKQEGLL